MSRAFWTNPPIQVFDLIFADPPYLKERGSLDNDPLLSLLIPFLEPNGLFIWNIMPPQQVQNAYPWEVMRHKDYGKTGLTFLKLLHKNKKITL